MFGQVLPQSVLPNLSGPVLAQTSSQGVWGSATGALANHVVEVMESFDRASAGGRHVAIAGGCARSPALPAGLADNVLDA